MKNKDRLKAMGLVFKMPEKEKIKALMSKKINMLTIFRHVMRNTDLGL